MVGAAIASLVMAGVTTAVGGIMAYDQNKRAENATKTQAKAVMAQAEADAAEQGRQARMEDARAGIAQIQGEQEAERRSRILAQDIGAMYAGYAGNGLLVDGTAKDTVGAALRTEVGEAASDISTIRDNTAMNVWTHGANAASLRAGAANTLIAGENQASMLKAQAKNHRFMGRLGLLQTATGLPLVSSSGWNMAAATVSGMGSLRSSSGSTPSTGNGYSMGWGRNAQTYANNY